MAEENGGKNKGGRPPRDWEALFAEWLRSGLTRKDYLMSKGINPRSGSTTRNTVGWEKAIDETREQLHNQANPNRKLAAVVDNLLERPGTAVPHVAGIGLANSWQKIQQWRASQANRDFQLSDQVRMHIALILKGGLQRVEGKPNEFISTLQPAQVRSLALAAGEVQRMQRLALGLSTENIGLDALVENVPEHKVGEAPQRNLFIVEMTKGGKFVRARPRQAS